MYIKEVYSFEVTFLLQIIPLYKFVRDREKE